MMRKELVGLHALALAFACAAVPARAQQGRDALARMSLDSLLSVPVDAAARYSQTLADAPASVTILTADQIERYGWRTLDEALQSVRGFYTSYDRNYSYLGVRGFSRPTDYNNRIVLLLNGHVLNESVYNLVGIGTELGIDLRALERIEVVRGPGSALYGTGAMFAVVNLVTRDGAAFGSANASALLGSLGHREVSALAGDRVGALDFLLAVRRGERDGGDLYFAEFDAPENNHGVARGIDWDRFDEALAIAVIGDVRVQARANRRSKGIPTAAWNGVFNDRDGRTRDSWASLALEFERAVSPATNLQLRLHGNGYAYVGWYPQEEGMWRDSDDARWGGLELQLTQDFGPSNRVVLGGGYTRHARADYRAWEAGAVFFEGDYPYHAFALYVQDEVQLTRKLAFTAGLRFDGHSASDDVLSPRLAFIYTPASNTVLKLLAGEAFRAPSVFERFYVADDFKRMQPLAPERIRTFELVWQQRLNRVLSMTSSLYSYHVDDLIDTELDPTDDMAFFENRDRVGAHGFEVELTGALPNGVSGYGSWAVQRAKAHDTNERLTNSPTQLARAGITAPLFQRIIAAVELRYEAARTTIYGSQTDPVWLGNLHVAAPRLWHGLEPRLRVRNALNRAYATPGGFEHVQDAIAQDGRTVTFELTYRFE